jgi:hypothetical protein
LKFTEVSDEEAAPIFRFDPQAVRFSHVSVKSYRTTGRHNRDYSVHHIYRKSNIVILFGEASLSRYDPEDGRSTYLRNAGGLLPNCTYRISEHGTLLQNVITKDSL